SQKGEDAPKIHLSVTWGTESPGTPCPRLIPSIHAHTPTGAKLCILDMKAANSLAIKINKGAVIQLLQDKVTVIIAQAGCRMITDCGEEPLIGGTIEHIRTGVRFKGERQAMLVRQI